MSFEPCSDIRERMAARKTSLKANNHSADKENTKPLGVNDQPVLPRGRGRGAIVRERWEQRNKPGETIGGYKSTLITITG